MSLIDAIKEKFEGRQQYRAKTGGDVEQPAGSFPYKKPLVIGAAVLAGVLGYTTMQHSTGTTEVGVRFHKWTGAETVTPPGQRAFFLPFINDWYVLDSQLLSYAMSGVNKADDSDSIADHGDSLGFKTPDGNDIALELTALFQLDPTMAATIVREIGPTKEAVREKLIRPYVRSIPRDYFGKISSNDFADAQNRNQAAMETTEALSEAFSPYGIRTFEVQAKDFVFVNKEYREAVHRKKLADAGLPTVIEAIATQGQVNANLLAEAEKEKRTAIANADGEYNQAVVQANAYYDDKKARAEGILAEGRNIAATIRKERESMASSGGRAKIAMELADKIKGVPIIQVPQCPGGGSLQLQDAKMFELLGIKAVSATPKGN